MTDHADHAFVDQFLRDLNRDTRVGLIVLHIEHEFDRFSADHRMFRILFIERELRAVLQIFTDSRDRSGQRSDETDLDDFRIGRPRSLTEAFWWQIWIFSSTSSIT